LAVSGGDENFAMSAHTKFRTYKCRNRMHNEYASAYAWVLVQENDFWSEIISKLRNGFMYLHPLQIMRGGYLLKDLLWLNRMFNQIVYVYVYCNELIC